MSSVRSFMMRFYFVLAVFSAVALADYTYTVFEKVSSIPNGWHELATAPSPSTLLNLRIYLATSHSDLEQELLAVSDPTHERYGQHHSRQSLLAFTKSADQTVDAVEAWLNESKLTFTVDGDVIKVRLIVAEAEALLQTSYATYYQDDDDERTVVRTLQYSVPVEIKQYIAMGEHDTGMSCPTTRVRKLQIARQGISRFLEEYPKFRDMEWFLRTFRPEAAAAGANFTIESINGGLALQNITDSDNMALQYALGISWPAKVTYYSTSGRGQFIPDIERRYCGADNFGRTAAPTTPMSPTWSSWSTYLSRIRYLRFSSPPTANSSKRYHYNTVFSSGGAGPGFSCRLNNGKNSKKFTHMFPATCPWVTSVSGTTMMQPEVAESYSSGGFSETWPVPAYQASAVKTFFEEHPDAWQQWSLYFNKGGRGFPDVAAPWCEEECICSGATRNGEPKDVSRRETSRVATITAQEEF
ncbi:hypothetical protein K440DRAFT_661121 [Wilcoxina mikolae CBS 423.85]|nr:hypothetical protein K440DRAFT_661121 [Wilcoxina mikolae CBS 423.85]